MIFSRDYSRAIFTLKQEADFGEKTGIFGRAVVEIRGGKAKLMVYAQGLKNGCICSLYFICRRGEEFVPLKAVLVNIKNGRAEAKWDFNPDNILGSGFTIEDAAVVTVMTKEGETVLSAYIDRPVDWRKNKEIAAAEVLVSKECKEDKPSLSEAEYKQDDEGSKATPDIEKTQPDRETLDFTRVVNHFRKDLDELRRYAYMERLDREETEVHNNKNCNFDLNFLFETREKCCPFDEDDTEYIKIGLKDLSLVDPYIYKYANNPTVVCSVLKHGGLLLGKKDNNILLLMPYDGKSCPAGVDIGFKDSMTDRDNKDYRVLKIQREK